MFTSVDKLPTSGLLLLLVGCALLSVLLAAISRKQATPTASSPPARSRAAIVVAGILVLGLTIWFTYDLESTAVIYSDELFWMPSASRVFQLFVIERDYANPFWFNFENYYLAYHPHVAKLLIGASLYIHGFRDIPFQPLDWNQSIDWNLQNGFQLDPMALRAARIPVAILAVGLCLLIFWLGSIVASWQYGLLCTGILFSNAYFQLLGKMAMLDVPAVCFSLLFLVVLMQVWLQIQAQQTAIGWSVLSGIACGLAVGSKLSILPLVVAAFCSMLLLLAWLYRQQKLLSQPVICMLVFVIWAGYIFFALNPMLYNQPLYGTMQLFRMVQAVQDTPFAPTPTLAMRLQAIWVQVIANGPLTRLGLPLDWLMVLGGYAMLFWHSLWPKGRSIAQQGVLIMLLSWASIVFVLYALTLPASTDRYLLPMVPAIAMIWGYGLVSLWHALVSLKNVYLPTVTDAS